jgi:His-Xaa-Ser system radical SAM maturase HxsC
MLLKTKGIAVNLDSSLVGKVTRDPFNPDDCCLLICEHELPPFEELHFQAVLTRETYPDNYGKLPAIVQVPNFEHLHEGDIVAAHSDGLINTLYRVDSFHNTILATERCNSNCLMCSQPPKDRNDGGRLFNIYHKAIPLIPKDCMELGISGGEPTLLGDLFFELLESLKAHLPNTELHLLTNGRSFAWNDMAERLAKIENPRLMLGIPLYADYYHVHDYIVQAKDAFNQTMLGLHNLARYGIRIEIRVVLHKETIPRLARLARYIYKNLPFAEHVAFMGLEHIGYTPHNMEKLWIDPYDYREELEEAVEFLSLQGMNVSIYNSQLCVLPEQLWPYCRKSISDWKNSYLPTCGNCSKFADCGGLFTWNLKQHSEHIKAI